MLEVPLCYLLKPLASISTDSDWTCLSVTYSILLRGRGLNILRHREDSTTETELRAIAKPAHIGSS